jgi:hypothetical protein
MKKIIKEIIETFGILAAIPIILIGAFALFALVPLPWVKAQIAAKAREGTPLVEAIYAYRNATELFPETIDDLLRVTSIKFDPARWSYVWQSHSARLFCIESGDGNGLAYSFTQPELGWVIQAAVRAGSCPL